MPAGRPSKYDPAYCEQAIEHLSEGYSITTLAAKLGIGISTLYDWRKQFPEFAEALKQGEEQCKHWWEDQAREAAKSGNAAVIIFGLKNRCGWRDKIDITKETTHRYVIETAPQPATNGHDSSLDAWQQQHSNGKTIQ